MLLKVIDAQGNPQTVIAHGQETPVDHSGTVTVMDGTQVLLAANAFRSGWFLQNLDVNPLTLCETGDAVAGTPGTWQVPAGGTFPPPGFPVTTGAVHINGSANAKFSAREW